MGSPQDAALLHRLSRLRSVIQSLETDLPTASHLEKPDIELMINFYEAAERNAKNEIELHRLIHGGIDARRRACANPERYVSKAPPPPIDVFERAPQRRVESLETRIAWKKAELESELRKAKARRSELKEAIAEWYANGLPDWSKVTTDARTRWPSKQKFAIAQYCALQSPFGQQTDSAALLNLANSAGTPSKLLPKAVELGKLKDSWKQAERP